MNLNIIFIVCVYLKFVKCTEINIAGIFDENERHQQAFKYIVETINQEQRSDEESTIIPLIEYIKDATPYQALETVCELLQSAPVAVIGPRSPDKINVIQSVCDEKEIPHIISRWSNNPLRSGTLINMYPHPTVLSRAYIDIISILEWKTFTVLYEDDESLLRLSTLIKVAKEKKLVVDVAQLDRQQTGIYRTALKECKTSGQKFFVIDCHIDHLKEVLFQVQQVGMMTSEYNYFITNLDTHTEDLTVFQYSETNITGIRLVNPDRPFVQDFSSNLYADEQDILLSAPAYKLQCETALIIDAVQMYIIALKGIGVYKSLIAEDVQCDSSTSWAHGYTVINLMKTGPYMGLTGLVKFDNQGFRTEIELDIIELREGGVAKVGVWNSTQGINVTRVLNDGSAQEEYSMKNKTYIVAIALTDPYNMLKETHETLKGNERFEGFGIDLIHELSLIEGFHYIFQVREDKKNGNKDDDGNWDGMIGDIMNNKTDLAITDLTITAERAEAVDFTNPFMNLGISILFREPGKAPPNFFSFAEPFANDTWLMLALSFFGVSFSLFIMGRLCQDEWTNPYPCIEEPEFLINQLSLQNSIWFAVGGLLQQGSEIAPIAISTRMVAGVWWFFVLIMVSSYTANLAAFLATENPIWLFTDVVSLVENAALQEIRYGAKANGATANFFRDSKDNEVYQKIYRHMNEHPEDMVKENDEGVALAEQGNYAFFMESTSIQYVTQRHCTLKMYGKLLDDKGYGIAMRKNSPYRQNLILAILKLQSTGVIENIRRKWWEERRGGGQCSNENAEEKEAEPLDVRNVGGVFWVTIGGVILSAITVLLEYSVYIYKSSRQQRVSFMEALKQEIKFFLDFESNVKPATYEDASEESKSKSKSDSQKERESQETNNIGLKPLPYGFTISVSKEKLSP